MFAWLADVNNYESRKVARTLVDGLVVSTAYTSDEGYETAICESTEVHPVQRYESIEEAREGHEAWCEKAKTLTHVNKLGAWGGLVKDEIVEVTRMTEEEILEGYPNGI